MLMRHGGRSYLLELSRVHGTTFNIDHWSRCTRSSRGNSSNLHWRFDFTSGCRCLVDEFVSTIFFRRLWSCSEICSRCFVVRCNHTLVMGIVRGQPVVVDPVYGYASYHASLPREGNATDSFVAVNKLSESRSRSTSGATESSFPVRFVLLMALALHLSVLAPLVLNRRRPTRGSSAPERLASQQRCRAPIHLCARLQRTGWSAHQRGGILHSVVSSPFFSQFFKPTATNLSTLFLSVSSLFLNVRLASFNC
jgi:hypothetical protein